MADVIKMDDGTRIDRPSQKILTRLNQVDWMHTGTLQNAAELSQNGQVLYRLEEHLIPGGLVEEGKRRTDQDTRRFRLTRTGGEWLDAHQEEVARPASRVETQQMAHEALEEASSAKESVQNYRKKVSRIDGKVNDVEDDVDELEEQTDSIDTSVEYHSGSLQGLRDRKADEADVEDLDDEMNSRIEELKEQQKESVNYLGGKIEELREEIAELQQENEELWEVIEKMQRGRIEKFRDRFSDD